jgi:drug/metabolite transporter (DMT)-like permease
MTQTSGALAALGSASLWAFASTRYALASRALGSPRVNLARTLTVLPIFLFVTAISTHGHPLAGVTLARVGWLTLSVICAYAFADNLFFAAARRVGITTALAIASSYPLWAAFVGTLWRGEPFSPLRGLGTALCVGGIIALILLAPRAADEQPHRGSAARSSQVGIALALVTSVLWAGNTVATKLGGSGLLAWQANLVRFGSALPILLASTAVLPRPTPDPIVARATYRGLVPVSLAEACVGSSLFVYALAHTDLAVGATLTSLAPLISVPFALLYREERWSPTRFAAVLATVGGVIALVLG